MQREFWPNIGQQSDAGPTSEPFLPTPTASKYGSNRGGKAGRVGKERPSLETMARTGKWIPTPTATDAKSSRNRTCNRHSDSDINDGVTLTDAVTLMQTGEWMSSAEDSPARQFLSLATFLEKATRAGSGHSFAELSKPCDRTSSWRKMSQGYCQRMIPMEGEEDSWEEFSETWPRSGMMRNGTAFRLPTLAPRISGIVSGSLPTPNSHDSTRGAESKETKENRGSGGINLVTAARLLPTPAAGRHGMDGGSNSRKKFIREMGAETLSEAIQMFPTPSATDGLRGGTITDNMTGHSLAQAVNSMMPTPSARDHRSGKGRVENGHTPQLCEIVGGLLSPDFVEWLMGFPQSHTKV